MRPEAAGVIIDASALRAARSSVYLRTLINYFSRNGRPIVVPATALVVACASGAIEATELDPPEITVTALTQAIAPAVAMIIASADVPPLLDVAHTAYEAAATGYPVLTTDPEAYRGLAVEIDVEELPG